jgi:hypothetical protein
VSPVTSRRAVLAAPVLALASACGGGQSAPRRTPAQVAADDSARDRALAAERDLVARYDAALKDPSVAADPGLAARLTAIRAEHAEHLTAVGEGYARAAAVLAPDSPGASPSVKTPNPSSAASVPSPGTPGPTSLAPTTDAATQVKDVVGSLVKAEQDASGRLTADIMDRDGRTAQLFASIAASEAGHAALLLGGAA